MPTIPSDLRDLMTAQHGLIRRGQALEFISEATLRNLLKPDGLWRRVVRGVYATFSGELTLTQRRQAALLYAAELIDEPDAPLRADLETVAITGAEGCRMHGLRSAPASTEIVVLIQHGRRRQSRGLVVVERTRRFPRRIRKLHGFPVVPIARCVIDATRQMESLDDVRALIMEAVQRRRVPLRWLQEELALGTLQGSARPRRVLDEVLLGAHSVPEAGFVALLPRSEILPPAHHNCTLETQEGVFLAVADGYIDDVGLAGEVQSIAHHLLVDDQDADIAKRTRLSRLGVETFEVRPRRLDDDPGGVLEDIEAIYLERKRQGIRPSVVVRCRPGCPVRRLERQTA